MEAIPDWDAVGIVRECNLIRLCVGHIRHKDYQPPASNVTVEAVNLPNQADVSEQHLKAQLLPSEGMDVDLPSISASTSKHPSEVDIEDLNRMCYGTASAARNNSREEQEEAEEETQQRPTRNDKRTNNIDRKVLNPTSRWRPQGAPPAAMLIDDDPSVQEAVKGGRIPHRQHLVSGTVEAAVTGILKGLIAANRDPSLVWDGSEDASDFSK